MKNSINKVSKLLTIQEVSEVFGGCPSATMIRKLCHEGKIKHGRVGNKIVMTKEAVLSAMGLEADYVS